MLLGLLVALLGTGLQAQAQDARIRNVQTFQEGKRGIIQYDLLGVQGATYDVDLRLSQNGGATFDYIPTATSGAVGSGIPPGRDNEIVWAALQDFPDGLKGQNFQFKVLARREGPAPGARPTSQTDDESTAEESDGEDAFNVKIGGGLSYNARQTIEVQYYDGYQVAFAIESTAASLEFRANYFKSTGTFSQEEVIDVDLLYNGGFYYVGAGAGMFNSSNDFFDFENNQYNLNGVGGIGFTLGDRVYPYIEYRIPFSRGKRDDVLSGGLLFVF